MKKIIALVLIFTMLVSLTACAALKEKGQQRHEEQSAALPKGRIEGITYVCEDAGIRFVKSAGWHYFTEDELSSLRAGSGTDEVLFDMFAIDSVTDSRVMVVYQPFNSGLNSSLLESSYVRWVEKTFVSEVEDKVEFGDPRKKVLGDQEYTKIQGTIMQHDTEDVISFYIRIEQKYVACILIIADDETVLKMTEQNFK